MRGAFVGIGALLCVVAGSSSTAQAADMPVKAPPMVFTWSGVYAGAHVGYGWSNTDWTNVVGAPVFAGSHRATGWLGGLQLGINYQTGRWVFGLEGEYSWAGLRGSHISLVDPADVLKTNSRWMATAAVRAGYTFDRTLIYAKGGAAWVRNEYTKIDLGVLEGVANITRTGWLAGAGVEHALGNNWSVKAEYNYIGLGTRRVTLINPAGGAPDVFDIKQNVQTVKLGVNYRFWAGVR